MRTRSRLLVEPPFHPSFNLVLIGELTFSRLRLASFYAFANIDGVLKVFLGRIVRESIEHPSDVFLGVRHRKPLSASIRLLPHLRA
jgi:hypothetical protein